LTALGVEREEKRMEGKRWDREKGRRGGGGNERRGERKREKKVEEIVLNFDFRFSIFEFVLIVSL
jgi:hypothetical protein